MVRVSGYGRSDPTTSGATTSVAAATHDGRRLKILTLLDEYTRECLVLRVERQLGSNEVECGELLILVEERAVTETCASVEKR